MSLFNAGGALSSAKAKLEEARASHPGSKTWQQNKYAAMEATQRRIAARLNGLEERVGGVEGRQDDTEAWQADCQKHVEGMERKSQLPTCPSCKVFYVPGPRPCQSCGYSPRKTLGLDDDD